MYRVLVGRSEGNGLLGISGCSWEDNFGIYLKNKV
jgi:hypothetical protein